MDHIRVVHRIDNLEIISKLMNSVAKQCGCRVTYCPDKGGIRFYGDESFKKYVAEETLAFFQAA